MPLATASPPVVHDVPVVSRAVANDIDWATVIVSVRLPVPAALVAPRETGKVPVEELVPEIDPRMYSG